MARKSFKCCNCGSKEIRWDALVCWNEFSQSYKMTSMNDRVHICNDCGEELAPEEIEIDSEGKEILE